MLLEAAVGVAFATVERHNMTCAVVAVVAAAAAAVVVVLLRAKGALEVVENKRTAGSVGVEPHGTTGACWSESAAV